MPVVPPPAGLRVSPVRWQAGEALLLSYPLPRAAIPPLLTRAEREVAEGVIAGLSSLEIARRRGRSVHTVNGQVSSVFRKAGIGSRVELIMKWGAANSGTLR